MDRIPSLADSQWQAGGGARSAARLLAASLATVSEHVAQAAVFGAETAHRLAALANALVDEVEAAGEAEPEKTVESLKRIALLTKAANEAADLGINLLKANKDVAAREEEPAPVAVVFGVVDAARQGSGGSGEESHG